jgi:phage shock protein C
MRAGTCGGTVGAMSSALVRPRDRKVIAGVCAALAARFGLSTFLVRLGFVIFGLVGVGELVYIALWIIIPKER